MACFGDTEQASFAKEEGFCREIVKRLVVTNMLYVNYIKGKKKGWGCGARWSPIVEIFDYKVRGLLTLSFT